MIFIPFVLLIVVGFVWMKQYENSFFKKPPNYPNLSNINSDSKPLFIAFGDSLSQGNMSCDWLKILSEENESIQIFNAGMNADLTDTLLTRIEDVVDCNPQIISLLVGSNDLMATMSKARMKRYYDLGKITEDTNIERFTTNYRQILETLTTQTQAKILIISLPPITEDFTFEGNQIADNYSKIIQDLAKEYNLTYIPFREKLKSTMPNISSQKHDYENTVNLIRVAGFKKNFLGKSWNEISENRKAKYLTDNIHLNNDGGKILAEMVNTEIKNIIVFN